MKTLATLLFAGLAGVAGLLAPATARADDSYDCTNGCYIITCNGDVCATWRCDDQGCRLLNTFYRDFTGIGDKGPRGQSVVPAADIAHARICPKDRDCEVWELTAEGATSLGRFDNLDEVLRERRGQQR